MKTIAQFVILIILFSIAFQLTNTSASGSDFRGQRDGSVGNDEAALGLDSCGSSNLRTFSSIAFESNPPDLSGLHCTLADYADDPYGLSFLSPSESEDYSLSDWDGNQIDIPFHFIPDHLLPDQGRQPRRDNPGPDWIQYDDGTPAHAWTDNDSYWARVLFTVPAAFELRGIRFMPYNPGPNNAPCRIRVYSEDAETHELQDMLWEGMIEELRPWNEDGNNWHWIELPEGERLGFEEESCFSIIIGLVPSVGGIQNPQEGDGWWMLGDDATETHRSYYNQDERPNPNPDEWNEPNDGGDLMVRANGVYIDNVGELRRILVPQDFLGIQEAIDNSADGDTIIVDEGVYQENIDFNGKNIVVASNYILDGDGGWMFFTIIDGGRNGAAVVIHNDEMPSAKLAGFTLRNGTGQGQGDGNSGGGLCCWDANPTLEYLHFTENDARQGGGLFLENTRASVSNCLFSENHADAGGGLMVWNRTNSIISNCEFVGNNGRAGGGGGAIVVAGRATPTFNHCEISDNSCPRDGGGIFLQDGGNATFNNCNISDNIADRDGGGVMAYRDCSPVFNDCIIENNTGVQGAAFQFNLNCPGTLNNCISRNNSSRIGGGFLAVESDPVLTDCIFTGNEVSESGGGVQCMNHSDGTIINCIITHNTAVSLGGGGYSGAESCPEFENCTIDSNTAEHGGGLFLTEAIHSDIVGCSFDGNQSRYAAGIMLTRNAVVNFDNCLFGHGVAEETGGVMYIGGESEINILNSVLFENSATVSGGVNIIEGSSVNISECVISNNEATFAGGGLRVNNAELTVTSSRIINNDGGFAGGGVFIDELGVAALVDCIINGNSAGVRDEDGGGAGIFCQWASGITLQNCDISNNESPKGGCGMYILDTTPIVEGCTVNSNTGGILGGGLFCRDTRDEMGLGRFTGCTFNENEVEEFGGGVHFNNSSAILTNCSINRNISEDNGGGIYTHETIIEFVNCEVIGNRSRSGAGGQSDGESELSFISCVIDSNSAGDVGGGLVVWGCDPDITDCIFTGNTTVRHGGGLIISDGNSSVENCIFRGNVADNEDETDSGAGLYFQDVASPTLSHCQIIGNTADFGGGIRMIGNSAPVFQYCVFTENTARQTGGAIYCDESSPELINCTISANEANAAGGFVGQNDSNPIFLNCIIWMNDASEIAFFADQDRNSISVAYSDIQGARQGVVDNHNCAVDWGEGNINDDPEFTHFDNLALHLDVNSPCIDASDPESPEDPDGTRADMGALYHHQGPGVVARPDTLNFRMVEVEAAAELSFSLANFGDEDLTIEDMSIENEAFGLDFEEGFVIQPLESRDFVVTFAPVERQAYESEVVIISDDPLAESIAVALYGIGYSFTPPEVRNAIPDQELEEDFNSFAIADLDEVFHDGDGDELEYSVESDCEDLLVHIDDQHRLWLESTPNWYGEGTITLEAEDHTRPPRDVSVEHSFSVVVMAVNDPPTRFSLLTPEHFSHCCQFPEVMFTWGESCDEVEDSSVTYTMTLSFAGEILEYNGIIETFHTVPRSDISTAPNDETHVLWTVYASDGQDSTRCESGFMLTVEPLSIREPGLDQLPEKLTLNQAYPNPFNAGTVISFGLPVRDEIAVSIFDQTGRLVRTLHQSPLPAGWHQLYWNGRSDVGLTLPAGLYLYQLRSPRDVINKRFVMLK